MRLKHFVSLTVISMIAVLPMIQVDSVSAATTYTVLNVGTIVGTGDGQFDVLGLVTPVEVNEAGDVVANTSTSDGSFWAVPFTNFDGKVRRLGRERAFSFALDLNNSREIVGYVTSLDDTNYESIQAVVWRDRDEIDLPGLGGDWSQASANNDDGDIIGVAAIEPGENAASHAVLWRDDEPIDLGTLGGVSSHASDISEAGLIVGRSEATDREGLFPCVWEDGEIEELPTPEGMRAFPNGVNEAGAIVGVAITEDARFRALQWSDREPELLPELVEGGQSFVYSINDDGIAVGWADAIGGQTPNYVAAVWTGDEVIDLNTLIPSDLGYALDSANSINNAGQILASGADANGNRIGVLLTPDDDNAANSPLAHVIHVTRTELLS